MLKFKLGCYIQLVQENLRISQMRQKSYAIDPFFGFMYLELAAVMHGQCCLYIVGFSLFYVRGSGGLLLSVMSDCQHVEWTNCV